MFVGAFKALGVCVSEVKSQDCRIIRLRAFEA